MPQSCLDGSVDLALFLLEGNMSKSFIPAAEGKFDLWANTFVNTVKADPTKFEVTAEKVTELESLVAEWDATYADA